MYFQQNDLQYDKIIQLYGKSSTFSNSSTQDFHNDNQSTTSDSVSETNNIEIENSQQQMHQFSEDFKIKSKPKLQNSSTIDRFIPNRKSSKLSIALSNAHEYSQNNQENINPIHHNDPQDDSSQLSIANLYKQHVLNFKNNQTRQKEIMSFSNNNLLKFNNTKQDTIKDITSQIKFTNYIYDINQEVDQFFMFKQSKKIPKVPYKVLDAPALQDDFYLNLIDWSSTNVLAVGLSSCVYLWSAQSSKVTKLCDFGITDAVTSVNWTTRGQYLTIGTNTGEVQIYDSVKLKKLRVIPGHQSRVGTLASNQSILTSGSRDKTILQRDLRAHNNFSQKLTGHKQEVCGLKWSPDNQQLASGGNDNKLYVWNLNSTTPIIRFNNHQAAVKALAWSPHQHGLLVSGGGTADRTIRFWNTLTANQLEVIDTGSQVCNLIFSKTVNQLVSTHGYSLNQIIIWNYPQMDKVTTLTGHTYRVLFLAMSPDGQTIVTGAGDETLRFWNVFPNNDIEVEKQQKSLLLPINNSIR